LTIDLLTAFIIAAVTALVVVLVMRSIAARQVAETRAASIAELAAAKQDLKWVREDAERKTQALASAQTLLDNAEKRLRDTFQALAANDLVDLRFPEPSVADGALQTAVVFVDSFGNVRLGGRPADLEQAIGSLEPGRPIELTIGPNAVSTTWQRTFGQVAEGQSLLYEDSFGLVSFADNQGNVAARLGIVADQPVRIRAA